MPERAILGMVHHRVSIPESAQLISYRHAVLIRTDDAACGKARWASPPVSERGPVLDPAGFSLMTWSVYNSLEEVLDPHRGSLILAGDFNNWSERRSGILHRTIDRLGLESLKLTREDGAAHRAHRNRNWLQRRALRRNLR